MKKQNVRTLSLIVCTFTYLLVGAAVFDALESETEKKRWEVLQAIESMVIRKYNITPEDFRVMETVVLKTEPHKAGQQWKFTGAFYYATTVLTTIGYGHSTPTTIGGKLFTMFYAIVGIPLGLIMFQSIGERVNRLSSVIIRSAKTALKCAQTAASELDLICVVTTLSSLTIAGGAAAFSKFEGWSYFDSVYYCFITLTTIGFGDMVALQKDNALNRKPSYVIFSLVFILFGLAIVAACLNLLVLRFVTMNTEDERRDEQQAMQALRGAVRLEGDVITADGEILRGVSKGTRLPADPRQIAEGTLVAVGAVEFESAPSVCSCSCGCFGQHKEPYQDPLSPMPPTDFRPIARARENASNKNIPRFIEKSSSKSQSQTLRLNSASGCLYMNARGNDFQIDSDDFKEIVRKRQEQLRKGMSKLDYTSLLKSNADKPLIQTIDSCAPSCAPSHLSVPTDVSQRTSIFSMNDKRSTDFLMEDHSYEESSYARRKLKKNVDRNLPRRKEKSSYFYDDSKLSYDADYLYDSSTVFAKRRKVDNKAESIPLHTFSVDPVAGDTCPWYCQTLKKNDSFHYGPDQLSNDGSFGYYLTPDDEEEYRFVNDTLTFVQPEHRSSI